MNYLMIVDDCIQHVFQAEVIGLILHDVTEREDYWERRYYVAWQRDDQCGTHAAHVDSHGMSALFLGHYNMNSDAAMRDMLRRGGMR